MPELQPIDPPSTPGRGFFFEEAEISQRAVTSPGCDNNGHEVPKDFNTIALCHKPITRCPSSRICQVALTEACFVVLLG